jgi:ATPase related to the helicase subunit of the Holliday junction resolvase
LPEELRGSVFYEPGPFGFEREVAKRLAWWADLKAKVSSEPSPGGDKPGTNNETPAKPGKGKEEG